MRDGEAEGVRAALQRCEQEAPWAPGCTLLGLSKRLRLAEASLLPTLSLLVQQGRIAHRDGYYTTLDFVPQLSAQQRAFFDRQWDTDPRRAREPVAVARVVSEMKAASIPGLAQAFETLQTTGAVARVGEDLYRAEQIDDIQNRIETALQNGRCMTVSQLRDLIGTSRKYVVPLLEWFDAAGLTVRDGDLRALNGDQQGFNDAGSARR